MLSIAIIVSVGLRSRRAERCPAVDTDEAIGERTDARSANRRSARDTPPPRSEPPDRWSSTARPLHVDIPNVYRTLKMTTKLALVSGTGLGVEAQATSVEPYMIGMIQAIRAIDPSILTELKDTYADEMCGKAELTPAQIIVYAKAVTFEAKLGSSRGVECALKRSPNEDVVTWSLLDAWIASGREPLPAVAALGASARDERTRSRLNPDQERAELLAARREAPAADRRATEATVTRATNTSR